MNILLSNDCNQQDSVHQQNIYSFLSFFFHIWFCTKILIMAYDNNVYKNKIEDYKIAPSKVIRKIFARGNRNPGILESSTWYPGSTAWNPCSIFKRLSQVFLHAAGKSIFSCLVPWRQNSELTQQDGRMKTTVKGFCWTNVTGLLLASFVLMFT